jgi:hypothetical protein
VGLDSSDGIFVKVPTPLNCGRLLLNSDDKHVKTINAVPILADYHSGVWFATLRQSVP